MKKIIFIFFTCFYALTSFAQGESWNWYFGYGAGLNFPGGGSPVALTNGALSSTEGCATLSDASGNLLLYTDGIKVWNKNHLVMPNGTGLLGTSSSTQCILIQKPGSNTIYYIFTTDEQSKPNGLRYTEVDLSLNGGNGDVTSNKNILLYTPSCEKITAVKHCNNTDIWIVSHDWNSNNFRSFLVTSIGVNTAGVISSVGISASGTGINDQAMGQLKASPDGTRLGSCNKGDNWFEIFDFNRATGAVSNPVTLPKQTAYSGAYGCEFSPDGTKFYGATIGPGKIYQWNLCAGSTSAVAASGVLIGQCPGNVQFGSMQLGPDGKIYVARTIDSWLGVINSPNTLGTGCNYVDKAVSLNSKSSAAGLPSFLTSYFKPLPPLFTTELNCLDVTFTSPAVNLTNCNGSTNAIASYTWNFDDPASGGTNTSNISNPTHTFSGNGTYQVMLILNYNCGADTIKQNVLVNAQQPDVDPGDDPAQSCMQSSMQLEASSSISTTTVMWSGPGIVSGINTFTPSVNQAGSYIITVKDTINGCVNTGTVIVSDASPGKDLFIPNAFSPNDDKQNDLLEIFVNKNCIKTFNFFIYDRWGEKVFETSDPKKFWDGYYKGQLLNTGVFAYYFYAILTDDSELKKHGNITLIQ